MIKVDNRNKKLLWEIMRKFTVCFNNDDDDHLKRPGKNEKEKKGLKT